MKEKELEDLTQRLNDLFSKLIKGSITEDEFKDLSDELYKRQTSGVSIVSWTPFN